MRDVADEVMRENVAAMTVALFDIRQKMDDLLQRIAPLPTPAPSDAAGIVVTKDELRALTHSPGVGFSEDGIEADGWRFASWERGFSDAISVVNQRIAALTAARGRGGA